MADRPNSAAGLRLRPQLWRQDQVPFVLTQLTLNLGMDLTRICGMKNGYFWRESLGLWLGDAMVEEVDIGRTLNERNAHTSTKQLLLSSI